MCTVGAGSDGGLDCQDARMTLHPAENRGYRELYLFSRQLAHHWSALATRLEDSPVAGGLTRGSTFARDLVEELGPLTAAHGLHGQPAAAGLGASVGRGRSRVRDRFLERNQAVRFAVGEVQHVVTLLAYLERLSSVSANEELEQFASRWQRKLRRLENEVRRATAELGAEPDGAIRPLDSSLLGRAAHSIGQAAGAVGEWLDRRAAERS
jgi:hypothetical protein